MTIHNLHFLTGLMAEIRKAIREERLPEYRKQFFIDYGYEN